MGCLASLCNDNDKDNDFEEENGQFKALIVPGNASNPSQIGEK